MSQVLPRALHLLFRPGVLVLGTLLAGGGLCLFLVPLFGVPGYELSLALSVGIGLLGGGVGIAAGRQERRMLQGRDPRPRVAVRLDNPLRSVLAAWGAACTVNLLLLAPPLLVSIVQALVSSRCNPLAQIGFFPPLTLPSAALASMAGVFCALLARSRFMAGLLYALLVLGSLVATAWPIVTGPQVFAFNHFLGYLPGPLYDEALTVTPALWWFRAQTLLLSLALWALAAIFLDPREGRLRAPHPRPLAFLLFLAAAAAGGALWDRGPQLGTRMTHSRLEERLGGRRETSHFTLHYPRGKPREEVERLARDLELRHAQLSRFFGQAPEGKLRVYLHRSPQQKRELVGAAATQFAKPWLMELHLHDEAFPHPVLKHELAHLMAAPFGSGPFRVTTQYWLWPNVGVIEGMAVAADDRVEELTLHEWSAGMRRQKLLPDIREMLQPRGFYRAPPSRAYTAAGSFLRYLSETQGSEKLRALYAHGDFRGAYGRSLEELASEWESFLDRQPIDAAALNQALARFRRGSIFVRPCAREVALLSEQAAEYLHSDPERAEALYRRCAEVQPEEHSFRLGQAQALLKAERQDEAARLLAGLWEQVPEQPAIAAEVALVRADLARSMGELDQAREHLLRVLSLNVPGATERAARVKLAALSGGPVGNALWAYFQPGHDEAKAILLREALETDPKNPYLGYLLGRRLAPSAPGLAQSYLDTALAGELPDGLRREAFRLKLETQFRAGDCRGVRQTASRLPPGAGLAALARSWTERCDFEETAFHGPLVPEGPFR